MAAGRAGCQCTDASAPIVCAASLIPVAFTPTQAVSCAFGVLSDEQQRRKYDHVRYGGSKRSPGSPSFSSGLPRPADVHAVLHLDFRGAALGASRTVTLDLMDACQQCGGSGAQPGSTAPPCRMCKGRREIVKLHYAEVPTGRIPGAKQWLACSASAHWDHLSLSSQCGAAPCWRRRA